MATLPDDDRKIVWSDFMSRMKPKQRAYHMTKTDMKSTVDAFDDWFSGNMAQLNGVFPTAARQSLTDVEKIGVIAFVAMKRFAEEVT